MNEAAEKAGKRRSRNPSMPAGRSVAIRAAGELAAVRRPWQLPARQSLSICQRSATLSSLC